MTERLYYNDSHLTEFDARVVALTRTDDGRAAVTAPAGEISETRNTSLTLPQEDGVNAAAARFVQRPGGVRAAPASTRAPLTLMDD